MARSRSRTLYLVVAHAGEYEDRRSWAVVVYANAVDANTHANAATAWARRWHEKHREDYDKYWEKYPDGDDAAWAAIKGPKSPFDPILERYTASDVTYGVRHIQFHYRVPVVKGNASPARLKPLEAGKAMGSADRT